MRLFSNISTYINTTKYDLFITNCNLRFMFVFDLLSCRITNMEMTDLLTLLCVMFLVFLSLTRMVFWVKFGTYLYRFLIFAFF